MSESESLTKESNRWLPLMQANSQFLRENHANSKCVPRHWSLRQQATAASEGQDGTQAAAMYDLVLFCSMARQFFNRR